MKRIGLAIIIFSLSQMASAVDLYNNFSDPSASGWGNMDNTLQTGDQLTVGAGGTIHSIVVKLTQLGNQPLVARICTDGGT